MTRSLFWKIFISFWLTQTAIIAYVGVRAHQMYGSQGPLWEMSAQRTMPLIAESAVNKLQTLGPQALAQQLQGLSSANKIYYWLLDARGQELSGQPIPLVVTTAIAEHRANKPLKGLENHAVLFTDFKDAKGNAYTLVGEYVLIRGSLLRGEGLLRILLISTVLSCLTCLLLAHYLTRPVTSLRNATRKLAAGDLDARAGKNLGTRADEIADLVRDFDRMADRLRDLVQSQRRLLSDVSHELRSPLARLRVALALARRGENIPQRESHDRIEQEVRRLDELIGRILTLSRLESGQIKPQLSDVALNRVIAEIVEDAEFEADRTGHVVRFVEETNVRVNGNEELLRSAFENVIRNAIYYTTGTDPVEVRLAKQFDDAVVTVQDHGPGVPADVLPDLFRPFYRVDDSRVTGTGGTGLGLAIAEKAVALHQGKIFARNAEPNGLVVEVRIPLSGKPSSGEKLLQKESLKA